MKKSTFPPKESSPLLETYRSQQKHEHSVQDCYVAILQDFYVAYTNRLTESEVETVLPNENGVEIVTLPDLESRVDIRGTRLCC